MARIIERSVQPKCTPKELQKVIREEIGTRLHITNVRKTIRRYGLTPKVPQSTHQQGQQGCLLKLAVSL